MRSQSSVHAFVRLCGAAALGVYLGGALAGLVAVWTGDAVAAGSPWPHTVLALVIVGAGVGLAIGWLTRHWLLPRKSQRWLSAAVTGTVTLPLFTAVSQLRAIESVGVPLVVLGGLVMATVYWRVSRTSSGPTRGSYARSTGG